MFQVVWASPLVGCSVAVTVQSECSFCFCLSMHGIESLFEQSPGVPRLWLSSGILCCANKNLSLLVNLNRREISERVQTPLMRVCQYSVFHLRLGLWRPALFFVVVNLLSSRWLKRLIGGVPGSNPGQPMRDLCCAKGHWDGFFFPDYCVFVLLVLFQGTGTAQSL